LGIKLGNTLEGAKARKIKSNKTIKRKSIIYKLIYSSTLRQSYYTKDLNKMFEEFDCAVNISGHVLSHLQINYILKLLYANLQFIKSIHYCKFAHNS